MAEGKVLPATDDFESRMGVSSSNEVLPYDPAGGAFKMLLGGETFPVAAGGDGLWLIDTSGM
jgi:hypothetical protein